MISGKQMNRPFKRESFHPRMHLTSQVFGVTPQKNSVGHSSSCRTQVNRVMLLEVVNIVQTPIYYKII